MASMKGTAVVYEFYHGSGDHYYSTNPVPYDETWRQNAKVGFFYESMQPGTMLLMEFYCDQSRDHYLSTNPNPFDSSWHQTRAVGN
jgi:hypothetical protein